MQKGDWKHAIGALERAVYLHPKSAARIVIYGNNLLNDYYPYIRLTQCHLELGELDAASETLRKAESFGEPAALRSPLSGRLMFLRETKINSKSSSDSNRLPEANPTTTRTTDVQSKEIPQPSANDNSATAPAVRKVVEPQPELGSSHRETLVSEPPGHPVSPTPKSTPSALTSKDEAQASPASPQMQSAKEFGASNRKLWYWACAALVATLGGWFFWNRSRSSDLATEENADPFREPEVVGPYRVIRLLGRGGFASTYLARHRTTGQQVALKVLQPHRMGDREYLKRFRQEARLGAMLHHPCIVKLLDPGPAEGYPWLAMEYAPGSTLEEHLKAHGAMPLGEMMNASLKVAEAMVYAHEHGVIHRDLKPGNVLMSGDQIKIMDFGIARVMDSVTLTTTYAFLGTPLYAAPEVQLKTEVDAAADRYSMGILMFEMLTGHPPFQGTNPFEILEKHRQAPVPDLCVVRSGVPERLSALVVRLLSKSPEERPTDSELLQELRQIQNLV